KRYKEMSLEISKMEDEQRKVYYRQFFHADPVARMDDEEQDVLKDVSLFNLIAAYKRALDQMPKKVVHEVELLNVSVEEQTSYTIDFLRVHKETTLLKLVGHMTEKIRIIVTLIAILEMTKNKIISLVAVEGHDDVMIRPAKEMKRLTMAVE
ncbi:MAG: segregation/condensation protein A, partial [Ignavibacteriae bacterium]|nr:segregation/condensation protein A [Ignavibacteriota bacterium]